MSDWENEFARVRELVDLTESPPQTPERKKRVSRVVGQRVISTYAYSSNVLDYSPGDLIFGLNDFRDPVVKTLSGDRFKTIDKFNNLRFSMGDLRDPEAFCAMRKIDAADLKRAMRYFCYLKNMPSRPGEDEWIAAACVRSIKFIHKETENRIHFLLDGLVMDDVFNMNSDWYDSFTSKELREVKDLADSGENILETVKFYRAGSLVDAPWRTRRVRAPPPPPAKKSRRSRALRF